MEICLAKHYKQEANFMGLFSFLADAGEKIFGGSNAKAEDLKKSLDAHGLDTKGINVQVDGDKVILKGSVKDQPTLEKAILAVGNNQGISGVTADEVVVESPAEESVFYTVKKGDTLSKIAASNYGKEHANKYTIIFEANKPMLKDPDKIYPGQVLRIPPLK